MPALHGNYIDLLVLVFLGVYAWGGLKRGFLRQLAEMGSFIGGFGLALRFYPLAAKLLVDNFSLTLAIANAIGFVALAIAGEIVLGYLLAIAMQSRIRKWIPDSVNKILGVLPAFLDGLIVVAVLLSVIVILPVAGNIKTDILDSRIGGKIVTETMGLERTLNQAFGGVVEETLGFLTVAPGSRENINLHFSTPNFSIDEASEQEMVRLVNHERTTRGIRPLNTDDKLRAVARAHSEDMLRRGYFSHVDPDGHDPFFRMEAAGISFLTAGENLAYAPNLTLAYNGLMNSTEHRENILNSNFSKIGVGVADGGIYGKMFTQEFTN